MPKNDETTTKFKVDISELKAEFQEAQRQVRIANSEFKAASAGMDDWGSSADGLEAKLSQLNKILSSQKSQLAILEKQYELTAKEQGENSKGAEELMIKINNQKAAIGNTEKQIRTYTAKLTEIKSESDGAEDSTEDLNKALDETEDSAQNATDGFTVMKGALASLVADGIKAATEAFGDMITATDKAQNTFQTQTGASTAEMEKFSAEMEDLYKGNYGEDMNDIAESMAKVAQNSKETDPSKIKELTKNALILKETFGYDVTESMRAVNMLMDQFGITGEEAYNLIAQGAQNGLDKNGDLLDTINEYGVHYSQLGYTSEEFFNSLKNGTDAGTFSVDKLGDAMKEFGIRTKDTATTTDEGFQLIGLNADEMREKFAAGGDSAQEATAQTMEALLGMDDQVKQNQAGVDLFGTMWEDLGIEGVKALMDVNGEADKTADTMKQIDEVKYDDIGSQMQELGRTLKTEILQPIVNEIVPKIKEFVGWLTENLPVIEATIVGIGTAMATYFVASKIMALVAAWQAYKVATEGATVAQWLLTAAQNASPMMLLISLIAGLVAAFVVLWNKSEGFREFWIELWENIKSVTSTVITAIKDFFVGLWEGIKSIFSTVGEWFSEKFMAVKDAIIAVITPIKEFFIGIWESIKTIFAPVIEWFSQLFSSVFQTISDIFNNLIGFLQGIWELIKVIFTPVAEWFKEKFQDAWDAIKAIWEAAKDFFTGIWEGIKEVFSPVIEWFEDKFSSAWDGIKSAFSAVGSFFSGVWESIKKPFSTVASWFKNTFKTAWEGVKNVFSAGGKIFDGIKEGIADTFKTVVNGIIKGINKVISVPFDAINGALRKIRDISIAGVEPFKDKIHEINVPQIPELARGGVLKKGQVGYLEGNGDEAVVPLQKNTGWLDEVASRLYRKLDASGSGLMNVSKPMTVNNNFYQTNNSPKALTRLEIYRQSKNLLSMKGV